MKTEAELDIRRAPHRYSWKRKFAREEREWREGRE
jgi:hypothetical protein